MKPEVTGQTGDTGATGASDPEPKPESPAPEQLVSTGKPTGVTGPYRITAESRSHGSLQEATGANGSHGILTDVRTGPTEDNRGASGANLEAMEANGSLRRPDGYTPSGTNGAHTGTDWSHRSPAGLNSLHGAHWSWPQQKAETTRPNGELPGNMETVRMRLTSRVSMSRPGRVIGKQPVRSQRVARRHQLGIYC
jgi:hypothetical protein